MYVIKRNGTQQDVKFDKILDRLHKLCNLPPVLSCDYSLVAQKVISGIYPGVTTSQLDDLAAETAAFLSPKHPDYAILASRISVSNLHKNSLNSFSETMTLLYENVHPVQGSPAPLLDKSIYEIIKKHAKEIDNEIQTANDYLFDYFGFKTLERSYLMRLHGIVVERPQYLFMRVSLGIHRGDLERVFATYHAMSEKWFIHATPTLFNAGTPKAQMSSCFLLQMNDDSIEGIFETIGQCAIISKYAGGIGLSVHNIRASGSYIAGTNGQSNGLVPMLRVVNDCARYVDQGGGKRKGSFAIYLEPWHADIQEFLEMRKNHGNEESRGRDLFYGLWIPDLFMHRVRENGNWTLFCPNEAPGLFNVYGKEFEELYESYEAKRLGRKVIKAQELWTQILTSQIETGNPYILYKDSCNEKSNQKNLGTIRCSNLCTEIIQYTSKDEIAVCNLASINLSKFAIQNSSTFEYEVDFKKLCEIAQMVTLNLNRVIDSNYYPLKQAENSNFQHRPIGIGVQGLADLFIILGFPFESIQASQLNRDLFETIYYGACLASMQLAKEFGPYSSFAGSPMSKGQFQFDLWNETPNPLLGWDWNGLRSDIMKYGIRNSLLVAPMPTASTSQILGNNECFEPYTSNMYVRRVLAGEFPVINKHLVKSLINLDLWNEDIRNQIIADHGSIQNVFGVPQYIKDLFKTAWEMKQRSIIDLARGRAPFIDQSQSLNIFMSSPTIQKLTSMHFYAWQLGLKTGMYYLRTRPVANAIQFTVDQESLQRVRSEDPKAVKGVSIVHRDDGKDESSSDGTSGEEEKCYSKEECLLCGS